VYRWVDTLTSKGLSIYQQAILQRITERGSINIVEVCNLVLTARALKKDPSFKPSIWSRIDSLEELDNNAQGMYRMPAVWIYVSWHDGTPKLEQRSDGWYDYNHVMYRDGQVLFQTKDKRWIIRGVKMSAAQFKRQIQQQILDMERREKGNLES
jgi:hypothetical protein